MTIDHRRPDVENTETATSPGDVDVLIKEARQRQRRRYFMFTSIALVLVGALLGLLFLLARSATPPTKATSASGNNPVAASQELPLKSRIWTLDMLNPTSGYAVAGLSSAKRDESLITTSNAGTSWSVVGPLPYPFVAGEYKPLLQFVTPQIGYTQALWTRHDRGPSAPYVTTNGGKSWTALFVTGQLPTSLNTNADASTSPDFRFSNGVLTLVSLQCTILSSPDACPSTLSEYRLGAKKPFSSHSVTSSSLQDHPYAYLLAAGSSGTALVEQDFTSLSPAPFDLTTNGGRSWSLVTDPCKYHQGGGEVNISGVNLTSTRWLINCSEGTGMNHATVTLSDTTNDGQSWSIINFTPAWSAKTGAIAGEIGQVWASNGGVVLWSYSTLGFIQASTNGGRTWSPIEVNGKTSNMNTGGWPIEFDPVGRTGAYFVTKSGQVLLSKGGINFRLVRLLREKAS